MVFEKQAVYRLVHGCRTQQTDLLWKTYGAVSEHILIKYSQYWKVDDAVPAP